ncbi:MAG: glucuronate isomerase [Huintestinicola sp.]
MNKFMDENFLLKSELAVELYHKYAKQQPIFDYHCHLSPREIAEDKKYDNITQLWLGGDHYKWRLMRQNGIDEAYITGDASDYDKFTYWAKALENAVANPLYHWSHLELKRYFGYEGELNSKTADEVWNLCNEKLQSSDFSARELIKKSNVYCIGTTDDPVDSLEWHKKIQEFDDFDTKVIPTFRPDRLFSVNEASFIEYLDELSKAAVIRISDLESLKNALRNRMEHFAAFGCVSSDHSFSIVPFVPIEENEADIILKKRLSGELLSERETLGYITSLMLFLAREYKRHNWVMQLHFGVVRNSNTKMFGRIGKDTGFDRILGNVDIEKLALFLDDLDSKDSLPKTVLYSLNPNDNAAINILCGCFNETGIKGKVQHGAAWWFNDHKTGMEDHLQGLADSGSIAVFIGMLTDSRSFLSYTRHEYFRRILCNFIADKVNAGEFANDTERLGQIVKDISFGNAKEFFL